jgi:ABC-type sugar transport system ATPase subunit
MGVELQIQTESSPCEIKKPLLQIYKLSKAFPGVQALANVSLDVFAGEIHALVGENGSGKSTLAKCIAGVHQPESGQIFFNGEQVNFHSPLDARLAGIATIYQEFSLIPSLTVAENIYLGRYPRTRAGFVDWAKMRRDTLAVLESLSLTLEPDSIVGSLSVAEQQLVEIAKAISLDAKLLIMDEPTAALGLRESRRLMELIRHLTQQQKAIIYISHRLDEVYQIADRVTILKDGKRIDTVSINALKMSDMVRMMIGFDIDQHYPKEHNARPETLLYVDRISTENGVREVSFDIKVGEVFGLGGMLGSGRTEIARAIYGADRIVSGQLILDGKTITCRSPKDAVAQGIGMIPENRKSDGCFFNFEGTKNITISRLVELLRGPFLDLSLERKYGEMYIKRMSVTPTALERSIQYLSGGNQQKVIIARWLFSKARLLIMDEPTQGIDIGAKLEIYRVINELTANGISILLISSDFPELLALSDRIAIVRNGRVVEITDANKLTEYRLMAIASGVSELEITELKN